MATCRQRMHSVVGLSCRRALQTLKVSANATTPVRCLSWRQVVAPQIALSTHRVQCRAPLSGHPQGWGHYLRRKSSTAKATSDSDSSLDAQAVHEQVLLEFFDKMDIDENGQVNHVELEAALDKLFSSVPSYYAFASKLLWTLAEGENAGVSKEDWMNALRMHNTDGLPLATLLPDLKLAVEALEPKQVRRRARQRVIFGNSMKVPSLQPVLFPKQRIENMSSKQIQSAGLRRFEHILEGYEIVDAGLGGGSFARVFLVRNQKTGDLQAMKRIDREQVQKTFNLSEEEVNQQVEHEFRHLQHTEHPHIVKLFEFCQDAKYSYFVMEAANGGDLKKLVDATYASEKSSKQEASGARKLSEGYVAMVLEQALHALQYLHSDHRLHKDIKLENLMLVSEEAPPHILLIDLGFTEMLDEDESGTGPMPAGTPGTMAPEVIDTFLGRRPQFNEKCDIWSVGVCVFELLSGKQPYEVVRKGFAPNADIDYEATREIMNSLNIRNALKAAGRTEGVIDMTNTLLTVDPDQRPSALDCLRHEWLVRQGEIRKQRLEAKKKKEGGQTLRSRRSSVGSTLLRERSEAISSAVNEFGRKSALQRAAAYHCASHVPLSKITVTESFKSIKKEFREWREGVEDLEQLTQINSAEDEEMASQETANLNKFIQALENTFGIDEACARYVCSALGKDEHDVEEFATNVEQLCKEREQILLDLVSKALNSAGEEGLTLDEVHGALERGAHGDFSIADVQAWLQGGAPLNFVTLDGFDYEVARIRKK